MRIGITTVSVALLAAPLRAQHPQCNAGSIPPVRAACNTAVDATRAFHPLAGVLVSSGNPVLGSGTTLGGVGHLSASVRVNGVGVSLPNPDSAAQGSVPSSFDGQLPAPVVEAAVGVFPGTTRGLLSLDVLASASLLPTSQVANLTVESGAARIGDVALGLGYGVRVGVLRGSLLVPSLSVSVMRRHLPRLQYGDAVADDPIDFSADLDATNWRLVASWRLVALDLAAGLGVDAYGSTARIRYRDGPLVRVVGLDLHNSRQLLFADAGLSVAMLKLVAELGYQTGKDQDFSTNFSDFDPAAGHVFWSAGVRFVF